MQTLNALFSWCNKYQCEIWRKTAFSLQSCLVLWLTLSSNKPGLRQRHFCLLFHFQTFPLLSAMGRWCLLLPWASHKNSKEKKTIQNITQYVGEAHYTMYSTVYKRSLVTLIFIKHKKIYQCIFYVLCTQSANIIKCFEFIHPTSHVI